MINFPVFERIDISSYGLFPGDIGGESGLHVEFPAGLTLVIGTNGLGKTTLITILFRMLTGPFDIPGLSERLDLGNVRLEPRVLAQKRRVMFAQRVVDGAKNARARLGFTLGGHSIVVERRLRDLALTQFRVDGGEVSTEEVNSFQAQISQLAGISSFADWILLLRHLVFYLEDRRALVWDASAQRQILRFLFLPPEIARKWSESERSILVLDSRVRNLNVVLSREERTLTANEKKAETVGDVKEELRTLEDIQEVAVVKREALERDLMEAESGRQQARLRLLNVEQEREARYREFERSKLMAIESRFPARSETARFILAQLMTDNECLACGSIVPDVAADYGLRIEESHCVVCGTDLSKLESAVHPREISAKRIERTAHELQLIDRNVYEARVALEESERHYVSLNREVGSLSIEVADRSIRIDTLIRQLPPEDAELHERRSDISLMRSRLEKWRQDLNSRRNTFRDFVGQVSIELAKQAEGIKAAFGEVAKEFLLEECQLVWSPQKQQLGETGMAIEFPAFELDMTGADFASPVRRTGPEQVSESQREFIDIAFRMALIAVAGCGGSGSLVIDAPESSLDAVFVARAATVLSKFPSQSEGNRLVIASNLIESSLIPKLIDQTVSSGHGLKIVDLLRIAAPTAAVRALRGEYYDVRDRLLAISEAS
jgi:hypothetical protein